MTAIEDGSAIIVLNEADFFLNKLFTTTSRMTSRCYGIMTSSYSFYKYAVSNELCKQCFTKALFGRYRTGGRNTVERESRESGILRASP